MRIIYGEQPKALPINGGQTKYLDLWAALDSRPIGEWLKVDAADVGGHDKKHKHSALTGSGFRYLGKRIQAVAEDDFFFVRIRPDQVNTVPVKRSPALVKVAAKVAQCLAAAPAPKPITAPAPKPMTAPIKAAPPPPPSKPIPLAQAPSAQADFHARRVIRRDPAVFTSEASAMLTNLHAKHDAEEWANLNLGSDPSYYPSLTAEVKALAKQRFPGFTLDHDIEEGTLYCRLLPNPG